MVFAKWHSKLTMDAQRLFRQDVLVRTWGGFYIGRERTLSRDLQR